VIYILSNTSVSMIWLSIFVRKVAVELSPPMSLADSLQDVSCNVAGELILAHGNFPFVCTQTINTLQHTWGILKGWFH